jgi:hypothetical protein
LPLFSAHSFVQSFLLYFFISCIVEYRAVSRPLPANR